MAHTRTASTDVDAWTAMQKFYAAEAAYVAAGGLGAASYDEVAAHLHPDVVLFQAPGLPFSGTGTWRGREGLEQFLAAFCETWSAMEFLDQRHWSSDDTVIVLNKMRFHAKATGATVETDILQLITVHDGLMIECRPFYWDQAAITRATQG